MKFLALSKLLRSRWLARVAVVVGYVALTIWSTWPLVWKATYVVPTGALTCATVPLLNVWTMWWNADRLAHGFKHYWHAPIFYPDPNTFAFSEPQPTTLMVAPIIWLTENRTLAYNVYLLVSIFLNGVSAERVLRVAGVRRWTAAFGGAAMLMLPIVHWQIDVVQLVPLWGILWTWIACVRWGESPSVWRGIMIGLAFSTAFLTCGHHGLFLALLVPATGWILQRHWFSWRCWVALLAAAIVAGSIVGPIAWHMKHALAHEDFKRSPELVAQLSATVGDYTISTQRALIRFPNLGARDYWGMSPGWLKLPLMLWAVGIGLFRRRWRRWTLFLLLLGTLAFILSLGTNLKLREWQPWWTLVAHVPGFSRVRNVFRFAFFVQMVVALLAAQGLYFFDVLNRRCCHHWVLRSVIKTCLMAFAAVVVLEIQPLPLAMSQTPDAAAHAGWIRYVREHTPPDRSIVCLPLPKGYEAKDFEYETFCMYYGTYHHVPMVNGYSGFFPADYFALQDSVNAGFPRLEPLEKMYHRRVHFIVVNRFVLPRQWFVWGQWGYFRLERVFEDPIGIDVYQLHPVGVQMPQ